MFLIDVQHKLAGTRILNSNIYFYIGKQEFSNTDTCRSLLALKDFIDTIVDGLFNQSNFLFYSLYYAEVCNEFAGSSLCHCTQATQLLLKKCRRGDELVATLCPI